MYDRKKKHWECGETSEEVLRGYREAAGQGNAEAMFLLADSLLSKAPKGDQIPEAVFLMEKAVAQEYPAAALAMAQMFRYGWGVGRSWKRAVAYYEKAAALGNPDAAAELAQIQKARRNRLFSAGAVVLAVVLLALLLSLQTRTLHGILVSHETNLVETTTMEEFTAALNEVIQQHDDALVISGERQSNRLLLEFAGEGIDLRQFPAATVIADEENFLVIQFVTDEDAEACLNALREMESVLFVSMDSYHAVHTPAFNAVSNLTQPYESPHTGETYYSWGVKALGYDQLTAWMLAEHIGENEDPVVVAVLDTGTEPCVETEDRILEGESFPFPNTKGWNDTHGHGTHVAGTVLDCTRGLNVKVLPVQVNSPDDPEYVVDSYVMQGIKYAVRAGAQVINLSLGGGTSQPVGLNETCDNSNGFDYNIRQAVSRGIAVVVSAGNGIDIMDSDGNIQTVPIDTSICCPAHLGEAIVVGACDVNGDAAYFSNYGEAVDVCAPGVEILSNAPGGGLMWMDGTSQAAPHVSALVAMVKLCYPDRTPAQIERYIKRYCQEAGDALHYGAGIPWPPYFMEDDASVASEADQRREDALGETGEITITMIWDTDDDLDLHCMTPSGAEISYLTKSAGGGTLDVDRQARTLVPQPVENIYFPSPDSGVYRVWVENFNDRTPGESSDAEVVVQIGTQRTTYAVTLENKDEKVEVTTFTY